jgi:hypothetical protein
MSGKLRESKAWMPESSPGKGAWGYAGIDDCCSDVVAISALRMIAKSITAELPHW